MSGYEVVVGGMMIMAENDGEIIVKLMNGTEETEGDHALPSDAMIEVRSIHHSRMVGTERYGSRQLSI